MPKFKVTIHEMQSGFAIIEADSEKQIHEMYSEGEIDPITDKSFKLLSGECEILSIEKCD